MDFSNLWDKFPEHEKEHMKYIILLFPCCFVVQYLFNDSFKDMNTFVQCIFAAATSIFAYCTFAIGVISVSTASGNREYLKLQTFCECVLSILLLIIVGLIFKFHHCTLYIFYGVITVVYIIRFRIACRSSKKRTNKKPSEEEK